MKPFRRPPEQGIFDGLVTGYFSSMYNACLLTSDDGLTSSLKRHFKYVHGFSDEAIFDLSRLVPKERITRGTVLPVFRQITREIEVAQDLRPADLQDLLIIVDLHDQELAHLEDLNPISREYGWAAVVAMLILAFPEAHWILQTSYSSLTSGHVSDRGCADPIFYEDAHIFRTVSSLSESLFLHQHGFRNLLDGTGLRNIVFSKISNIEDNDGNKIAPVGSREKVAAAIDEEEAYAYFNAYVARRFGYCAWTIDSWNLMQKVFGPESSGIHLLLEDLYLGFPDKNSDLSLSDLETRDEGTEEVDGLRGLCADSVERRVLITVGHRSSEQARKNWRKNRNYLRSLRAGKWGDLKIKVLYKPLSGIFNLWEEAGMLQRNRKPVPLDNDSSWAPNYQPRRRESSGHSTPGRLLVIAERLIERSKRILNEVRNVPDAIHAATLALEAKELLAGKTPTTSLEALALQHKAEVVAESMFHGIEFHLDVKNRFRDIEKEVEAIGRWFNGRRQKRVTLNARLAIIEDLAQEFSELDQFEEERKCRAEARRLYFDLWTYRRPWRTPFRYPLRYLSLSLRSLPVFFGLVAFWIVLFGVGYNVLDPYVFDKGRGFLEAFSTSTVYFFTLSMPDPSWYEASRQVLWNSILTFQSVISLSHLGILVSHIYLIVSRR